MRNKSKEPVLDKIELEFNGKKYLFSKSRYEAYMRFMNGEDWDKPKNYFKDKES